MSIPELSRNNHARFVEQEAVKIRAGREFDARIALYCGHFFLTCAAVSGIAFAATGAPALLASFIISLTCAAICYSIVAFQHMPSHWFSRRPTASINPPIVHDPRPRHPVGIQQTHIPLVVQNPPIVDQRPRRPVAIPLVIPQPPPVVQGRMPSVVDFGLRHPVGNQTPQMPVVFQNPPVVDQRPRHPVGNAQPAPVFKKPTAPPARPHRQTIDPGPRHPVGNERMPEAAPWVTSPQPQTQHAVGRGAPQRPAAQQPVQGERHPVGGSHGANARHVVGGNKKY